MTDWLNTVILQLVTPFCYDKFFVQHDFFHGECLKTTLSKSLGFGIVFGSCTVKIPQVVKIIRNRSGRGISLVGVLLELCAITSFFLYSYLKEFPFSSWGDGVFLALQTVAIFVLILFYRKQNLEAVAFLVAYLSVVLLFIAKVIPLKVLWFLQVLNLPIIIAGKGAQVWANYRSRSTGQLSAITYWILFLGNVARIFTSIQETGDVAIISSFIIAAILNGIIVGQFLYYAKPPPRKSKKGKWRHKKFD